VATVGNTADILLRKAVRLCSVSIEWRVMGWSRC